jgi:hypothetical protein
MEWFVTKWFAADAGDTWGMFLMTVLSQPVFGIV